MERYTFIIQCIQLKTHTEHREAKVGIESHLSFRVIQFPFIVFTN